MITEQEKLIQYYKDRLKKVESSFNPNNFTSTILKERCKEYIDFAKQSLNKVKQGRNW